jgi:hypothetical protein
MANPEQLAFLKDVDAWNAWRIANRGIQPDLHGANLNGAKLTGADLNGTDLSDADLSNADLRSANLAGADLYKADLHGAQLISANFYDVDLRGVNLCAATLESATMGWTIIDEIDLSCVNGLEKIEHLGPSNIGMDTIARSRGSIPKRFLQGCGLSDWEIEMVQLYTPNLTSAQATGYRHSDSSASWCTADSVLLLFHQLQPHGQTLCTRTSRYLAGARHPLLARREAASAQRRHLRACRPRHSPVG